jgi:hypothetical protein
MACIPAPEAGQGQPRAPKSIGLATWRTSAKASAGQSWADVGHRAPDGSSSNNLGIPGNYPAGLPVDEFMLLYSFSPLQVRYEIDPGHFIEWSYTRGKKETRTKFHSLELNQVDSTGLTAAVIKADVSVTQGKGKEYSNSMSWGDSLAFYGRIYHFQDARRPCYEVVPYVYQAKARTLAGVIYPYWEMDYYVKRIYSCGLRPEMGR